MYISYEIITTFQIDEICAEDYCVFLFQMSGFVLMSLGGLLLADNERILLSRLLGPGDVHPDQPLFYYLAFAIVALGFLIAITGLLGCWAACLFNRCITVSVRTNILCS